MITSFSHIYNRVRDVEEAIDWYTKNLGFRLLRKYRTDPNGSPSAYLELGDVLLELTQARDASQLSGDGELKFGLTVTDLDGLMADLKSKDIPVTREASQARTFWGRQAAITDPSGNGISLREWEAPDGPHYNDWKPRSGGREAGVERLA